MVFVTGMCVLGVTSLVAITALCRHPRLWLTSLGVLTTAAIIVLYLPVRVALSTSSNFDESSFDAFAEGFRLVGEFLIVVAFVGVLHGGLVLILIGSIIEERKRQGKLKRAEREPGSLAARSNG